MVLLSSWETMAITFQLALLNGGPVAIVYGCIFVIIGSIAVALSLAEMASMYVLQDHVRKVTNLLVEIRWLARSIAGRCNSHPLPQSFGA